MSAKSTIAATAVGLAAFLAGSAAQAFDFGNMMNPSRWFGGDNDRYYDRYYGGRYGPYGYGPYGGGWGGPYGGWGGPYGWGGYPGYGGGYPSTIVVNPSTQGGSKSDTKVPE